MQWMISLIRSDRSVSIPRSAVQIVPLQKRRHAHRHGVLPFHLPRYKDFLSSQQAGHERKSYPDSLSLPCLYVKPLRIAYRSPLQS